MVRVSIRLRSVLTRGQNVMQRERGKKDQATGLAIKLMLALAMVTAQFVTKDTAETKTKTASSSFEQALGKYKQNYLTFQFQVISNV